MDKKKKQNHDKTDSKDKLKILVLDDEEHFTEEMQFYLQEVGFETYTVNEVLPGLEILKNHKIDLMILDIRLRGANGFDILTQVKEEYPSVEVIIVCGFGDMETAIRAFRLGALDYIKKPFRAGELQIALERAAKMIKHKKE
jgi:DNA-binding NtrC family response regulator